MEQLGQYWKKRNKVGEVTPLNFKANYKVIIRQSGDVKDQIYGSMERLVSPESAPHTYGQLIFDTEYFFQQKVLDTHT